MIDLEDIKELSDEATFEDTNSQTENETVEAIDNFFPSIGLVGLVCHRGLMVSI